MNVFFLSFIHPLYVTTNCLIYLILNFVRFHVVEREQSVPPFVRIITILIELTGRKPVKQHKKNRNNHNPQVKIRIKHHKTEREIFS